MPPPAGEDVANLDREVGYDILFVAVMIIIA